MSLENYNITANSFFQKISDRYVGLDISILRKESQFHFSRFQVEGLDLPVLFTWTRRPPRWGRASSRGRSEVGCCDVHGAALKLHVGMLEEEFDNQYSDLAHYGRVRFWDTRYSQYVS